MFDKIQHIGYLTSDLKAAIGWVERSFGAVNAGGGSLSPNYAVPSGGRNAYLQFGQAEAEIIEPDDKSGVGSKVLDRHHLGYVVESIEQTVEKLKPRGFAVVNVVSKPRTELKATSKLVPPLWRKL